MTSEEILLSEIWIYPIKSLGGVQLKTSKVLPKGLEYDRRWMLTDESGRALTQREHPKMALFRVNLKDTGFEISHGNDTLDIPFIPDTVENKISATVWDDTVQTFEVNGVYNAWFSSRLGISCRLLFFPETSERPVDPNYRLHNENVSLADAYPLLIIGQQSLNALNQRLQDPVPMNRFRPNLVFSGGAEFIEDTWSRFNICGNRFAAVKPCARCVLTTVDQQTGIKGSEPLKTLSKFRTKSNKVLFGQNVLVLATGDVLRIGDQIVVETLRTETIAL